MPMKLYAHPEKYAIKKILVAASYAGLDIEIPKNVGSDEVGRIPVLETDNGCCIFSSGAIARYISRLRRDVPLYGSNLLDAGMIDSWTEFSTNELEVPLNMWLTHAKGTALPAEVVERAKADTHKALTVLNNHLLHFTYMVGEAITLADISLCCAVADAFKLVLSPDVRSSLGNLDRWFNLCMAQGEFQKIIGKVDKCGGASAPAKKEVAPKKEAAGKKDAPKAAAKAPAQKGAPAPAPAAAASGGPVDEAAVKAVGDDIRSLKEKLKAEGVTGKKLNDHPEVAALVAKLAELKKGGGAAPAPAAAATASAGPADEAAIKAVGDDIRSLKEKLKADGITGKKLNEHPEVAALVAKLAEMKKGGAAAPAPAAAKKDAAPKKEGGKKDGGKKDAPKDAAPAKEEDPAEARKKKMKKVIKEGGKRGVEIEGAADMGGLQFFCTNVEEPEGDLEMLEACMTAMNEKSDPTEEERKGGSGAIGKMIFSCCTEHLAVLAYVPEAKQGEISSAEWLKKTLALFGGEFIKGDKSIAVGKVNADGDKNIFPLKIREPMILEANNYLRKLGLFPEDNGDSDDEMVFGDDDFPSM